jgi:hypothetical protein
LAAGPTSRNADGEREDGEERARPQALVRAGDHESQIPAALCAIMILGAAPTRDRYHQEKLIATE